MRVLDDLSPGLAENVLLFTVIPDYLGRRSRPGTPNPAPGDVRHSWGHPSLAADVLRYTSSTDLRTGLASTVAWYLSSR